MYHGRIANVELSNRPWMWTHEADWEGTINYYGAMIHRMRRGHITLKYVDPENLE